MPFVATPKLLLLICSTKPFGYPVLQFVQLRPPDNPSVDNPSVDNPSEDNTHAGASFGDTWSTDVATPTMGGLTSIESLYTANLFVSFDVDLFPSVSLAITANKIEANFGPKFQFNISDGI
uniref:Uncharacterized protein n=1 Tax=Globodera rostochiensis TaxID=31243 RepID=A0A914HPI8_GLORO